MENEKGLTMRIVIKVGTSTLAHPTGRLNIQRIELLCKVMSDLKNAGHQIILVSSGAIAMGFGKLNLPERPKDVPTKQASAAVGQCELMYTYDKLFTEYNHTVAQLLITRPDIAEGGRRRENFHVTLERLLELGALPQRKRHHLHRGDQHRGQRYSVRHGGGQHPGGSADPAVGHRWPV